jgi:hypothetical protein
VAGPDRVFKDHILDVAYAEAGIGPEDLSLAEVYDLSTALELDWYEHLGLCAKGEAEQLLRSGATAIGGRIPVNPSGGLACFGEAIPAQAIAQVCELTWQLRGQATGRQVEGATVGVTATTVSVAASHVPHVPAVNVDGAVPAPAATKANSTAPAVGSPALDVTVTPPAGKQIVVSPTISFSYSGLGTSDTVYAQLVDNSSGLVLSNIVTPIPVTLDGRTRTVSMSMEDIAYSVDAGDSLTLQITGSALNYFDAWSYGGINISDITLDMPLHDKNS